MRACVRVCGLFARRQPLDGKHSTQFRVTKVWSGEAKVVDGTGFDVVVPPHGSVFYKITIAAAKPAFA